MTPEDQRLSWGLIVEICPFEWSKVLGPVHSQNADPPERVDLASRLQAGS